MTDDQLHHVGSPIEDLAVLESVMTLAPGETFQIDVTAGPKYGCSRQGGCNEINTITDPHFGQCIEFTTNDNDHTLPGTNSPPLGGCYAVHRVGGVASCLIAPARVPPEQKSWLRLKVGIPSSQPGLAGGFPKSIGKKWLSVHESYGPPFAGAAVTNLSIVDDASGRPCFVYGPAGQVHSFWQPVVLDQWFDFIIGLTPSTNPSLGQASVLCNGVALKSKAGNVVEQYATLTAADNAGSLLCYLQNYRSTPWGGTLRILFGDFRIGTTLASVTAGGPAPEPTPEPIPTPTPTGPVTLTEAQALALKRYITAHGIPTNSDSGLITAIKAELP